MKNIDQLYAEKPTTDEGSDVSRRLVDRFDLDANQLREAIKPLFLLMHDHGITNLTIERDGVRGMLTVDGKRI